MTDQLPSQPDKASRDAATMLPMDMEEMYPQERELLDRLRRIRQLWQIVPDELNKVMHAPASFSATFIEFASAIGGVITPFAQVDESIAVNEFRDAPPNLRKIVLQGLNALAEILERVAVAPVGQPPQQYASELAQFLSVVGDLWVEYTVESSAVINEFRRAISLSTRLANIQEKVDSPNFQQVKDEAAVLVKSAAVAQEKAREITGELEQKAEKVATHVLADQNLTEIEPVIIGHQNAARNWLIALCLSALVTLWVFVWMLSPGIHLCFLYGPVFQPIEKGADLPQIVSVVMTKLLMVSFSLGLCLFSSRSYASHIHNVVVNQQRKIAFTGLMKLTIALEKTEETTKSEIVKAGDCYHLFSR